jgi:hypothetical protein
MMMPRVRALLAVTAALLFITPAALKAAGDPILGTWKLNVQKSKFLPGPGFKSETRTYEQQPDGVKVTIQTVDAKGKLVTSTFLTTPDGIQHSVSGEGGPADAVALKRIDDYTAESTLKHAGSEIAKTTRVLSEDGNSMTITYVGLAPDGSSVNYRMVFEKVTGR